MMAELRRKVKFVYCQLDRLIGVLHVMHVQRQSLLEPSQVKCEAIEANALGGWPQYIDHDVWPYLDVTRVYRIVAMDAKKWVKNNTKILMIIF